MEFTKYNSIENSYREKEINEIRENIDENTIFTVTEKIDGCNMSLISDGNNVIVAKRTSILNNASLFDSNKMYENYKDNVLELVRYLKEQNIDEVQIFGEHFGGLYNGKTDKGYSKIQKRVQYIPYTDFIVFDILVTQNNNKKYFLNWDEVKELATKFGFKVVPELFRGTFEECLEYPNLFQTKIPEMYGLEPIEDNIAEGVVIKPLEDLRLKNGDRIIIKNKNDKFKEKGRGKLQKVQAQLNDEEKEILNEMTKYFEINRIQSVLSKGDVKLDWKQFNKLSGLFFKDALEDFIKDNPKFNELDKGIQKAIKKEAQKIANDYIRDFMKKHI